MKALVYPRATVGSDAFPLTLTKTGNIAWDWNAPNDTVQGHPRLAGTHAIVLRIVRENNLMPLMTAIGQMTYLPAKFLEENEVDQMTKKGRVLRGIMNFDQIRDKYRGCRREGFLTDTELDSFIFGTFGSVPNLLNSENEAFL